MKLLIGRVQIVIGQAEAHHHAGDLQPILSRPMRLSVRVLFAWNSVFPLDLLTRWEDSIRTIAAATR